MVEPAQMIGLISNSAIKCLLVCGKLRDPHEYVGEAIQVDRRSAAKAAK